MSSFGDMLILGGFVLLAVHFIGSEISDAADRICDAIRESRRYRYPHPDLSGLPGQEPR